jgi:hypothetical protein
MVTELRHLLEESVQHPPAEPHDTHAIVGRARRRRTRQRLGVAGSVLAVALVASGGYAVVHGSADGDAPVAHTAPVGPVVHLQDAEQAVEGKDYTVGATYLNHNLDRGNGRLYDRVSSDGRVVVSQATRRDPTEVLTEYQRFALQDSATGALTWLPAPTDARYADDHAPSGPVVVAVQGDSVVWLDRERSPMPVDIYDLGSRTWSHLDLRTKSLVDGAKGVVELSGVSLAAGRLYFVPETFQGPSYTRQLWSVPVDGSAAPRREAVVGDFAIDDGTLVYTEATNRPIGRITVRDLADGAEHSFDPESGDRCNQLSISLAAGIIGLGEYCGRHDGVRDDRVHVLTTDGRPLVTIQGNGVDGGAVGRGFVLATTYGQPGAAAGTFVYDIDAGRLLRLSTGSPKYGPGAAAGGTTLTWSLPVNHRHGMKLFAGRWG